MATSDKRPAPDNTTWKPCKFICSSTYMVSRAECDAMVEYISCMQSDPDVNTTDLVGRVVYETPVPKVVTLPKKAGFRLRSILLLEGPMYCDWNTDKLGFFEICVDTTLDPTNLFVTCCNTELLSRTYELKKKPGFSPLNVMRHRPRMKLYFNSKNLANACRSVMLQVFSGHLLNQFYARYPGLMIGGRSHHSGSQVAAYVKRNYMSVASGVSAEEPIGVRAVGQVSQVGNDGSKYYFVSDKSRKKNLTRSLNLSEFCIYTQYVFASSVEPPRSDDQGGRFLLPREVLYGGDVTGSLEEMRLFCNDVRRIATITTLLATLRRETRTLVDACTSRTRSNQPMRARTPVIDTLCAKSKVPMTFRDNQWYVQSHARDRKRIEWYLWLSHEGVMLDLERCVKHLNRAHKWQLALKGLTPTTAILAACAHDVVDGNLNSSPNVGAWGAKFAVTDAADVSYKCLRALSRTDVSSDRLIDSLLNASFKVFMSGCGNCECVMFPALRAHVRGIKVLPTRLVSCQPTQTTLSALLAFAPWFDGFIQDGVFGMPLHCIAAARATSSLPANFEDLRGVLAAALQDLDQHELRALHMSLSRGLPRLFCYRNPCEHSVNYSDRIVLTLMRVAGATL